MNLGIKRPLSFVHQVMNGEARNYRIELTQRRKRYVEIVSHDTNRRLSGEAPPRRVQHGRRKINGHSLGFRMFSPDNTEQVSVSGTQVENAPCVRRNEFEQRRFSFAAMRNRVRPFQIVAGVLLRSPKIDWLIGHENKV